MDLFVMNRYTGDEKGPEVSDEKAKLDKVLKKIKKRKLARERHRHEENLKTGRVSKFKKEKTLKKRLRGKFERGLLGTQDEIKEALDKKAIKLEELVPKIGRQHVIPNEVLDKVLRIRQKNVAAKKEEKLNKKEPITKATTSGIVGKKTEIKAVKKEEEQKTVPKKEGVLKKVKKVKKDGEQKTVPKKIKVKKDGEQITLLKKVKKVKKDGEQKTVLKKVKKVKKDGEQKTVLKKVKKVQKDGEPKTVAEKVKKVKKLIKEGDKKTTKVKKVAGGKITKVKKVAGQKTAKVKKINKVKKVKEQKETKTESIKEQEKTEVIPEDKIVELTPEEIAEKLLQKQIEDKIVQLTPEKIAQNLLHKQIEELEKLDEIKETVEIKQKDETKKSKKRKQKTEPKKSEEPEAIKIELTPEEIAQKLLQKQMEELGKITETKTNETEKSKKRKPENLEEPQAEKIELTPEEIAENLLQKQIEELSKKADEAKQTNKTKRSKKRKQKKTEPEASEEPETSGEPGTSAEPEASEEPETSDEPQAKKPKISPEDVEGFTILGVDKFDKKKTVKRVLPKWLRNPTIISSDLSNLTQKISDTDLNPKLKKTLQEKDINYLFPVQAEFIPWQLKSIKTSALITPQDACISAPTGSGKTLAFTIPVLQSLLQQLENNCLAIKAIRALIILPTQSLAFQIYDTFKSLTVDCDINIGLATGAGNRTLEAEQHQLITYNSVWGACSKVDVLICTAGRLVDHLKSTKGFDLKHLQFIIIDEADRVLDSIQDDWLYHLGIHLKEDTINPNIVNVTSISTRTDPQKLLFSATLSQDPEKLQKLSLFQPKLFTCATENEDVSEDRFIGKYTTPAELTEKYIICTIEIKPLVLYKLIIDEIDKNQKSRILVFVNTIETLHRLNVLLKFMGQEKFTIAEFSTSQGNLKARKTLLKKFEDGLIQVLVCTDSMARGIDIPNVDCVISYSVPNHLKTYIHRAGRTARAGAAGLCISMMHAKQQNTFLTMIENMKAQKHIEEIQIPDDDLEILTPLYEECLVQLKETVTDEVERNVLKLKTRKLAFNKKQKRRNRKIKKKIAKQT